MTPKVHRLISNFTTNITFVKSKGNNSIGGNIYQLQGGGGLVEKVVSAVTD